MADDKHQAESPSHQRTVATQADKFRELARDLECDEDEARFEEAVEKVAKAPKPEKAQENS